MLTKQDDYLRSLPPRGASRVLFFGGDQRDAERMRRQYGLDSRDVFNMYGDVNRFWGLSYLHAVVPDNWVNHPNGKQWIEILQLHGIHHPESEIITESEYRKKVEHGRQVVRQRSWKTALGRRGVRPGRRIPKSLGYWPIPRAERTSG